jgi:tungstate transport system permease protein
LGKLWGAIINYFADAFKEAINMLITFSPELYGIVFRSLRVTFTALILASLAGIPLGVGLSLKNFKGRAIFLNIINTFMSLPPVIAGLTVYILLSHQTGLVGDQRVLFTVTAMVIAQFVLALPLITGLTISVVSAAGKSVYLTAKSLGATPSQAAFTVVKEARYGIIASCIVVFGRLTAEVGAVMMVGGNIRFETRTMTTAIAMHKGMGEFTTALALGIVLLLIAFIINGALEILKNRGRTYR